VSVDQTSCASITCADRRVGIGKAIAEALAKTGASVALLDLDAERQAGTKTECENIGVKSLAYGCDVTNYARCKEVFAQIERDLGPVE
jgi:NAD(P)-dependent dehydrogenase (short-subunit alcohol dehydrogenase family)